MSKSLPRLLSGLLAVALGVAPVLRAEDNVMKPAATTPAVIHFVDAKSLDLAQILPPPPAADSLAARADIESVLQVQAARTPEQVAWAKVVDKNDVFAVFGAGGLLPAQFKAESFPRFVQLLKDINDDLRPLIDQSKKAYARTRPYALDQRVQPCVDLPTNDSYPSGHSYNGWMRASVLAEIFPEKRAELMDRARYFCWGRVLAGVHYPTDLEGGKRVALAGFAALMKSAAFRARIEECRAEAAAALRKKAA